MALFGCQVICYNQKRGVRMHKLIEKLMGNKNITFSELGELCSPYFFRALDYSTIAELKRGTQFITLNEDIEYVWILLDGEVRALQEYASGDILSFRVFKAEEVFGEMEALGEIPQFRASLVTKTDCVFLKVPVSAYIDFMKHNSEYLYKRTKLILNRELDDHRSMRTFLMIRSLDRLKIYLVHSYEMFCKEDVCYLKITRKQMHEETGYSIRTINRSIKQLSEEGYLEVEGQRLKITRHQYQRMFDDIEKIID